MLQGAVDMETEWQAALPRLREAVGERNFAMWIEPIRCARDGSGIRLEVPSRFYQEWVTRHFLPTICEVLGGQKGASAEVRVVVSVAEGRPEPSKDPVEETVRLPQPARRRTLRVGRLVPNYVFETFVVGPANQVAAQAAREVVEAQGRRYNPFFLWGGVGLGKTHLVNAIGNAVLQRPRRGRVACLSAETFMNTMIGALRQDQMNGFRERFRELDVLILDDVQFLARKERTQEEFFHTFEALYTAGRQIVLTSDKPPHAIADLEQRLRSRFEGGLIADVRPPTFEMRVEIALRKARQQGRELTKEIAAAVARCSGPSVRELEGALVRVLASAALEGLEITSSMVETVLAPVVPIRPSLSIDAIQACVADRLGVSVDDLRSHRRSRSLALARQIAMYLSRAIGGASLAAIAERFGGRDHTTVLYSVRAVEERKAQEPTVQALVDELTMTLRAPRP